KKYFFSILQILETLSLDPLQYVRTQSLTLLFTFLRDKPEQEQNLLRLLVNKLGDTEKPLCSRASYHLLQLLQSHPSMKTVVVREIIALVLRPPAPSIVSSLPPSKGTHIRFTDPEPKPKSTSASPEKKSGNAHARYYAMITFNQIVLTPGDRDVALKLIEVYFEMFKELLGEDPEKVEDVEQEVVVQEQGEVLKDKKGRVKVRDGKKKGKGKVTEVKGAAGFAEVEDTHSRLISAILTGVNRALPFAKIDAGDSGLNKHIDTLFLITHTSTFNISLQALVLIQQISSTLSQSASAASTSTSKSIVDRFYRTLYDSLHDIRLAASSKQAMYLNLLFKSIKADVGNTNGERIKAIVRRFVQVLASSGSGATEFVAGGLYLLGELFSTVPGLRSILNEPATPEAEPYDPRKRDPQYAHASSSPIWELTPLLHHYHPAISLHARQLLTSQPLTASADLSQNTLSHFLDRFVYKNPKKAKQDVNKAKGASAMQPAASGLDGTGVKLLKGEVGDATLMNEAQFLKTRAEDVPVDQLFYHKYFSQKSEKEKAKAAKVGKRKSQGEEADATESEEGQEDVGDEDDNDDEDEDEAEIWKAMQQSMPKAADDDEDLLEDSEGDDNLPSDFDMDDNSEDEAPATQEEEEEEEEEEEDGFSLVEGSDNEDLIPLDDDIPDGLIDWDGSDEEGAVEAADKEWGGIEDEGSGRKRKRKDTSREQRKKLKTLPTFASYEDYAKMIEDGPEDDI
ncbi:Ribosome biogenesis protein MAK21, partial [Termitomyces sp. T112]